MAKGSHKNKYERYIQPNLDVIVGLLRSGHTQESIAKRFGVGRSSWVRYKAAQPEFQEKIREGEQDIGALAVNNLVKRANGYDYDEITTEITDGSAAQQHGQAATHRRIIKKVTKHVPPDVAAICVIIFNRMADKWKNTQYIKHSGEIKNAGVLLTAPPMDREAWLQFYQENVKDQSVGPEPSSPGPT